MPGQEQLKVINFANRQNRSPPGSISGAAHGVPAKQHKGPKVCGTCLGDHSDHTNEIVECDGCGVTTHEACYGIQVGIAHWAIMAKKGNDGKGSRAMMEGSLV